MPQLCVQTGKACAEHRLFFPSPRLTPQFTQGWLPSPPSPPGTRGQWPQSMSAPWKADPSFSDGGIKTQRCICRGLIFLGHSSSRADGSTSRPAGAELTEEFSCWTTSAVIFLNCSWPPSPNFSSPPREAFLLFLSQFGGFCGLQPGILKNTLA